MKKKQKYWILFTHWECPICGHDKGYRERVYTKEEAGHKWEQDSSHYYECTG